MQLFFECLEKGLLAGFAVILYLYLVCAVYPRLTVKLAFCGKGHTVRGVRRVVFAGGRGVVYEPDLHVRRYLPRYALFVQDGEKYLRCSLNPNVKYIRYDVVSFDLRGKMLDAVSVSEYIRTSGSTKALVLPTATAYAYVIPRRVDGMYESHEKILHYPRKGLIVFGVLTAVSTLIMTWFLYDALNTIFRANIRWFVPASTPYIILHALLYSALILGVVFLAYRSYTKKVINR